MNTTSTAAMKFSVEVVILPVRDVDRALRFYVDQVGFTLDVDYSPIEPAGPDFFHVPRQIGSGWIDFRAGSGDVIACPAANFLLQLRKEVVVVLGEIAKDVHHCLGCIERHMRFSKELVRNGAPVRARCCGTGFAALHESGYGTKRTCRSRRSMSAFGGKVDISRDCQPNHDL